MASWQTIARQAAQRHGVPPAVFIAQIQQESGGRDVTSGAGAQGPAQFMPGTAREYGLNSTTVHQLGPSLDAAAAYMADNLKKYGTIQRALSAYNSGRPDAYKDPGFAGGQTYNYVKTIMGAAGSTPTVSASPAGGTTTSSSTVTTTPAVDNSALRRSLVGNFLAQGGVKSQAATGALASGWAGAQDVPGTSATTTTPTAGSPAQVVGSGISPHAKSGDPVVSSGQSVGGLHQTEGLPGFPAHDYFAPSGSHAVAPVSGTVVKLSGHDPAQGPVEGPHGPLGWSVYVKGSDGKTYFLTHLGSRNVKVGETVKQGQVIGTVADYAKYGTPSHIHMGVNG